MMDVAHFNIILKKIQELYEYYLVFFAWKLRRRKKFFWLYI